MLATLAALCRGLVSTAFEASATETRRCARGDGTRCVGASACFVCCGAGEAVAVVDGVAAGAGAAEEAAERPRGTNLGLIDGPVFFLNIELMVGEDV